MSRLGTTLIHIILATYLLIVACTLVPRVPPTTDPGEVLTQVAINIQTALTLTAAVNKLPSASEQPDSTVIASLAPTISAIPTENVISTGFTAVAPDTITPQYSELLPQPSPSLPLTPEAEACFYRASLEYSNIEDGQLITANKEFVVVWRLKNTGTCTWTPNFELYIVRGDIFSYKTVLPLTTTNIPPNGYVEIKIRIKAPSKPGKYVCYWMIKGDDTVFGIGDKGNKMLYIQIESYKKKP